MHGLSEAEQREQSAVQPSTAYMNSLFECILECKVQQSAEKQVQCDRAQFECEVAQKWCLSSHSERHVAQRWGLSCQCERHVAQKW